VSDFHQSGIVPTLHRLPSGLPAKLERELEDFSRSRPITLALPALYSEFERPALGRIVDRLKEVGYLRQIVVSLDAARADEFARAKEFLAQLPQPVRLIWNGGQRLRVLYDLLDQHGLGVPANGKGRAVWIALGYALAEGGSHMVALHDSDIVNYEREMLARLCYPIASPELNYEFSKGYYSRVNGRIYGRVTRLFVTPLLRALQRVFGCEDVLVFLDSFRYPLAGEFALTTDLARNNRLAGGWGIDFGLLSEVYRNCSPRRVCQVGLAESYEHKHQPISEDDPENGLFKMSIDITHTCFRTMAIEGTVFSEGIVDTLQAAYQEIAQDMVERYRHSAALNNLPFDRRQENLAVRTFARGLRLGGVSYLEQPLGQPALPSWNQVTSALPDFPAMLLDAVEADA
jgi:glucosyl-3-phosphoglycerate synthase